jgi:hypothetical protein
MWPNPLFQNQYITVALGKSSTKMWAITVIFQKLSKVNNCPIGDNFPNLVTLSQSKSRNSYTNRQRWRNEKKGEQKADIKK